jgi:hypothetical protein
MKISDVEMSPVEFLWKVVIVLAFVVPICIGGTAFVFHGLAPYANFGVKVFLTAFGAVIGTVAALVVTSLIIKIGHKEE